MSGSSADFPADAPADSPADLNQCYLEGVQALSSGDDARAEACLRTVVEKQPGHVDAMVDLGYVLGKRGLAEESEKFLRQALALNPRCAEALLNLGGLLTTQQRYTEAEAVCIGAINANPNSPRSWSNLGVLYARLLREAEAEQCLRTAMSLSEEHLVSRFNLSYLLLRQGHFEEGWQCLEARRWYSTLEDKVPCPRWNGEALTGKSLLIAYEAGHGDMIQFIRYAAILKTQYGCPIDLICHPALKTLFSRQAHLVDRVFAFNETVPVGEWDYWTSPLSLPFHCKTRLDSIPGDLPYLYPAAEKRDAWRARLPAGAYRVGLVWKGSTGFENDADRSLPSLDTLLPLADLPGIRFVGLQKGAGEDEAASDAGRRFGLCNMGPLFDDFSDTAAVVSQLDLVIGVDTAVLHLAGALGIPCWIMLPAHMTDWRWLKDRDDSPWYPGVARLFRQPARGQWQPVVEAIREQLLRRPARPDPIGR